MSATSNIRPPADPLLVEIADFAVGSSQGSAEARDTARWCLLDSLACGLMALDHPACKRLLGPPVSGAGLSGGARVPGTDLELDPITAAFNIGAAVRWLDFNDTWLAAEWGHPSDNLGAILAIADWVGRAKGAGLDLAAFGTMLEALDGRPAPTVGDVLTAMIKAHEIQGVLALENAFNRAGLDHVLLVRVASTAVATALLGGTRDQVVDALSQAWIDGSSLRTYRHSPNTGSRKSWAAGDATSRGVRLALLTLAGEMGYPSALTATNWGFQDASFRGLPVKLARPLGSYVMENILFKISFPAEFHGQTAVECALKLHPEVSGRLDSIERVEITTQEPAVRIIDKRGPLHNPADRDHCIQYMTAVALLKGSLVAEDYEGATAADPRLDALRARMTVKEEPTFSRDYLDPSRRSIANAVQVLFKDGTATEKVTVEYPLGHRRRRAESLPALRAKARTGLRVRIDETRTREILELFEDRAALEATPVTTLMAGLST